MGGCMSSPEDQADKARSVAIDALLAEEARKVKKEAKILLLGSGESGKSTIVKQMKILHQSGFTVEELHPWRPVVNKNLVESAQAIVLAMRTLNVDPENGVNRNYSQQILDFQLSNEPTYTLPPSLADAIESVWKDPVMATVIDGSRSNEFYLMDSAVYFFTEVRRICDSKYIPSETDVLRARAKTTGITETRFYMGQLSIHMFDVGGQRSERRKWIHCFEAVTSIIFCVAMSEYDQVLIEEKNQESLVLFESIVNSRWFLSTSIILFLNKTDIFYKKIKKSPLDKYYPEYQGGDDADKATKFLLWKFASMNRAKLALYPHLTQATDTNNIRIVFAAVKETILQNTLRETGIL